MTEETKETTVEEIEITPTFANALSFSLMTRRGALLKTFQRKLDELTDQDMLDLIEGAAAVLDLLGSKEAECNLLREAIEIAESTFESLDAEMNDSSAKLEEARNAIDDQVAFADEKANASSGRREGKP